MLDDFLSERLALFIESVERLSKWAVFFNLACEFL